MSDLITLHNNPQSDLFRRAQGDLDDVKEIMVENIERVLDRGEKISELIDRTANLNLTSSQFRQRSTGLRRNMWFSGKKVVVLGCILVTALLTTIAYFAIRFNY
jgi:vesicle-associated membrane protein 7